MKKLFTLAAAVLASFSLWANQTDLISGVTLPDVPASSLDMATQTFKTADENGWIVLEPNGDIRNASVTWFAALAWNTTSVTISDVSSYTAPFVALNSVSCTTVRQTERTKAIRFTGATDASFLASSTNKNYNFHVALYSIDGTTQTLVEDKFTGNAYTELYFSDLNTANDYVAYFYADANSNAVIAEIALKKYVNTTAPVAEVTIDGPAMGVVSTKASFSATTDVKANEYEWFVNGNTLPGGSNSKTMEFTPMAAGTYSVVCKARNANNATDQWAADTVAFKVYSTICGELIKAVHTGKTTATVTGIIGGTAHKSTESGGKINSNGYFGIQLASGNFQEGDTLVVNIGAENSSAAVLIIYAESTAENVILNTGVAGVSGDNKFVLPAAVNGKNALYIVRTADNAWNAVVNSISVIRPVPVDHADVALVGVAIDGEALPDDFVSHLINQGSFTIQTSYVNAPVVAFVKHSDIYYEGETEPVSTNDSIKVTATDVEGQWQAQATIGENTYTINAAKAASFTVTYMDGETELGTENVAANGNPAEYAQYQSKDQATFVGWYSNADLADEHAVADMSAEVITAATTYYAKFVKTYISANVNIEQLVLDYGTGYDIQSALTAAGWDYANLNSLDTLNDLENKTNRNYDFLGLKMKTAGAYIQGWIPADGGVVIKFGNLGSDIKVTVTGATTNAEQTFAKADLWDEDEQVYVLPIYGYTEEVLVKISTVSNGTVVLKQLMLLNEGIQAVTLPAPSAYLITIAESENGTVTANWDNKKYRTPVGATVTLTFTPAENYIVMSCTVNGDEIHQSAPGAAITFEMPAEDVTIQTTFSIPTAIDNAEAAVKAEKVIRDGQVLILRDGKIFNALGAEVK